MKCPHCNPVYDNHYEENGRVWCMNCWSIISDENSPDTSRLAE